MFLSCHVRVSEWILSVILTWFANYFLVAATAANQVSTFTITDTKVCGQVVTLSTQDNEKLFEQLKSGFKSTVNWNKDQSIVLAQVWSQYLDYLIDPSFQKANNLFVLSNENIGQQTSFKWYFPSTVEIKDCSIMIDWRNCFSQPVKSDLRTW